MISLRNQVAFCNGQRSAGLIVNVAMQRAGAVDEPARGRDPMWGVVLYIELEQLGQFC
jgi:hypothetical protein